MIGAANWVGRTVPFHPGANGKVFLAFGAAVLPPGELDPLHAAHDLRPRAPHGRARHDSRGRLRDRDRRDRGRSLGRRRARARRQRRLRRRPLHLRPELPPRAVPARPHGCAARRAGRRPVHPTRVPHPGARMTMTHDEILQGLFDNTLIGNKPEVADLVNLGPRRGHGAELDAVRRAHPVARGGRRALRARRLLRARDADRRPRDAGRARHPAPAARGRGRAADRHVRDGHRQGRRARHRQEPRQHHARGRRLHGHRPRRERAAGEVHRADRGAQARDRRLLGVPHDDDADVQGQHQRHREGRPARQGHHHGRRRARDPGVRRRGRRRRLRGRRLHRRAPGQGPDREEAGARTRREAAGSHREGGQGPRSGAARCAVSACCTRPA